MRQIFRPSMPAIFLIALHLYLLSQLSFTVWPEMMVIPHLMHHGFALYKDMVFHYTPGLAWILSAWFHLVGFSAEHLKLFTWGIIALNGFLIFRIARRWGSWSSFIALLAYVLLQPVFDGNGLWYELLLTPFLLIAFHTQRPEFLAVAFLVKQSVFWIFPLFIRQWKKLVLWVGGLVGASFLWFWIQGNLSDYFFWSFRFIFTIFPRMPGYRDFGLLRQWVIVVVPFALVFGSRIASTRSLKWVFDPRDPASWAVLSGLFIFPRFGLFHLQPAIAFLALSIGQQAASLRPEGLRSRGYRKQGRKTEGSLLLVACHLSLVAYTLFSTSRLLSRSWHRPDRFLEPDVYQLAARVALETNSNEPVFLVNGPELAYVLANRLPPKPWFTQFPWFLELPGFQDRVIESFKQQGLRQVIFTPYLDEGEFVPGSYQPKRLLEYLRALRPHNLN